MKKGEIVSSIAETVGMRKNDVESVLDAFVAQVTQELKEGRSVRLIGFGTFLPRLRRSFKARNPKTGQSVDVSAVYVPTFKSGKTLKTALAEVPVDSEIVSECED